MAQYLDRAGLRVVLQHIKSNYAKSADLTKATEKLSSLGISDISGLSDALTAAKLSAKVVDALPETGERGVLYLVEATAPDADGKNVYVEYVWIEGDKKFEKLGDTTVDLSDYVKKEQLNALSTKVDGKVDKEEGKGLSANDYTTAEKTKLEGIAEKATADEAIPVGTSADTTTEDAYATASVNALCNLYL